jgi:hypothetical protein
MMTAKDDDDRRTLHVTVSKRGSRGSSISVAFGEKK